MPKNAFYAQSGGVTAVINATASGTFVPVTVEAIQAVEGPRTGGRPRRGEWGGGAAWECRSLI